VEKLFRRRPQKVLLDIRKYRFRSSSYFTLSLHDALPILTDGVHQRFVGHHEKYRGIFRRVLVTMKIPERHDEGVALFPFVALIADSADAAAAPYMIDGRAGVAMAFGFFSAPEHVNLAGHCRQRGSTRQRIGVIQYDSIIGIARLLTHFTQSPLGIGPFVAKSRRLD